MLGVTESSQLSNVRAAGLIGMGPSSFDYRAELFIQRLKHANQIPEMVFSIYITDYFKALSDLGAQINDGTANIAKGSTIMIGGYDLEKFAKPGESIRWVDIA